MRESCYYCGGRLLGDGVTTATGERAHAVCESKGAADLDMNPEMQRSLRDMAQAGLLSPWMIRPYVPDGVDPADLSNEQIRRLLS